MITGQMADFAINTYASGSAAEESQEKKRTGSIFDQQALA
jgi:hypothetical protein